MLQMMVQLLADEITGQDDTPDPAGVLDDVVAVNYANGSVNGSAAGGNKRQDDDEESWLKKILRKLFEWIRDKMWEAAKEFLKMLGKRLAAALAGVLASLLLVGADDLKKWIEGLNKGKPKLPPGKPIVPDRPSSPGPTQPPVRPPHQPSPPWNQPNTARSGFTYNDVEGFNAYTGTSTRQLEIPRNQAGGMSVFYDPGTVAILQNNGTYSYGGPNGGWSYNAENEQTNRVLGSSLGYGDTTGDWVQETSGNFGVGAGLFSAWYWHITTGGTFTAQEEQDIDNLLPSWNDETLSDPALWSTINGQYVYWKEIQKLQLTGEGTGITSSLPPALRSAAHGSVAGTVVVPPALRYTDPSSVSAPAPTSGGK